MEHVFEAFLDNQQVKDGAWFAYTDAKTLTARVLPRENWSAKFTELIEEIPIYLGQGNYGTKKFKTPIPAVQEPIHLYLFKTPVSGHKNIGEHLKEINGQKTILGEMPTLVEQRVPKLEANLEAGFYYDLVTIGTSIGERRIMGGGRFATQKGKFPQLLTFDTLKLMAIEKLGLIPKEVKGIEAKISHYAGWGERLIHMAVFSFEKDSKHYEVSVNHLGQVTSVKAN